MVSDATRKVFDGLGAHVTGLVIHNLCRTHGLTEEQMFSRCDLVEKSIATLFSDASEFLIEKIKDELLPFSITKNPKLSLAKIANEIKEIQVIRFVRSMSGHEHVGFLYGKKAIKGLVLSQFFDPSASGAIISLTNMSDKFGVQQMAYEDLLKVGKSGAMSRMFMWIEEIHRANRSGRETRLAGEDASWFLQNGFEDEFLDAERSLGRRLADKRSVMCSYNAEGIATESQLKKIIESHGHIIIDQPLAVYRAPK